MTVAVYALAEVAQPQSALEVVALSWDDRCKPRQRLFTDKGTEVACALPRGTILADGDLLYSDGERTIVVQAKPESVLVIEAADQIQACTCAHHLGNWHRSLQVNPDGSILVQADSPLEAWLTHMNFAYERAELPYHPNLRGSAH